MFLIKGKLANGDVVKMKSDAASVFDAAKEFFSKMDKLPKEATAKASKLTFTYKDSAEESFTVSAPTPKKEAKSAKKGK